MSEDRETDTGTKVPVHPRTVRHAMARARIDVRTLAERLGVPPGTIEAWCNGDDRPTYAEARELARALHIGFSWLMVPPRKAVLPIPDLRRGTLRGREPSPELLAAVHDALRKRDWMRERRPSLDFVGSADGAPPWDTAREIAARLSVDEARDECRSAGDFLDRLATKAEENGVIVLRRECVGTDANRPYDPNEFAGFTIVDDRAPIVFVNASRDPARQALALVHGVAHVWLGHGGVCGGSDAAGPVDDTEARVDAITAAIVTRGPKMREAAVPRRAVHSDLPDRDGIAVALAEIRGEGPRDSGERSDDEFWRLLEIRNSPTLTAELRRAAAGGGIGPKDVAVLLDVDLHTALAFTGRASDTSA